jgi:hypothetical protein
MRAKQNGEKRKPFAGLHEHQQHQRALKSAAGTATDTNFRSA